jgi:hypothetical protein
MPTFRRLLLVAHVWLTAFLTLFAGLPHVSCRCPNGHVKPFCLSFLTGAAGCCCASACCPAPRQESGSNPGGPAKKSCCCHAPQHSDPAGVPARLEGQGCRKTLAETTPAAPGTETSILKSSAAGSFLLAPAVHLPALSAAAGPERLSWQSYRLPPPTDLVVTLQHFLI